ncbi:MAG: alanine racemase, partial [Dehalococcoidia bacterium]
MEPNNKQIGWGRPLWAEIDLDALAHNIGELKRQARGALLTAVVKANAYGHGAATVARAALATGAERLAVICVDEGEQLRRAGITAPILIMGHSPSADARRIVELQLTPTVNSREIALALATAAADEGITQPIHLKVDTGLGRYGLPPTELIVLAEALREVPSLAIEGLFTHFAAADEGDKGYTRKQYESFLAVAERLSWIPLRHASNTATLLDMPEMNLDLVRPGIGIYGCYPSAQVNRNVELRPVLSLKSRVVRLTR